MLCHACMPKYAASNVLAMLCILIEVIHHSAMRDLRDSAIIANMNVQPIRIVVHSHHVSLFYNTVFFRKILLRKGLQMRVMC